MAIHRKPLAIDDLEFVFSRITRQFTSTGTNCNDGSSLHVLARTSYDGKMVFQYVVLEEDSRPFVSAPFTDDNTLMLAVNGRINRDPSRDRDNEKNLRLK